MNFDALLDDPAGSGVYRVAADAGAFAEPGGRQVARIALSAVGDKTALLEAVAASLAFPDWFGGNWDALEDCLCDLSWRHAGGHLLLFDGHARLRIEHPDDLGVLLEILGVAAEFWRGRGVAFYALFADPAAMLDLPALPPQGRP